MTSWTPTYLGRHKTSSPVSVVSLEELPNTQVVLLLYGPRQPYQLTPGYPVPIIQHNEVLVRTRVIGLNPIDWKAPDFNFAVPQYPYISGKELSGHIVQVGGSCSHLKLGDRIMVISTDYRDLRKAAYQEYVASLHFTTVRIPPSLSFEEAATLGVGFVTATLALGVCMGLNLSHVANGPNLLSILHEAKDSLPRDVRGVCFDNKRRDTRARKGDWITVWGGSATSAHLTIQLAKLSGLKVAVAVDGLKHSLRISNHESIRPDLLVDSHDPQRAVDIIRANCGESLRFGIDTRGSESAAILLSALSQNGSGSSGGMMAEGSSGEHQGISSKCTSLQSRVHLVGLAGLPKSQPENAVFHTVPIKLFHEVPAVGKAIVHWLERLLQSGLITCPDIIGVEEGLENVNKGLDRMRAGKISGGKLVVRLSQ